MLKEDFLEDIRGDKDCPICGWDAQTLHTNAHKARCTAWQRACRRIGYSPMTRPEATEAIDTAQQRLEDALPEQDMAQTRMALIRAFYDRSLTLAIDNGNADKHPDFRSYASMLELPEMSQQLRHRFPHTPKHIPAGFTVWQPEGSRGRRFQERRARQMRERRLFA